MLDIVAAALRSRLERSVKYLLVNLTQSGNLQPATCVLLRQILGAHSATPMKRTVQLRPTISATGVMQIEAAQSYRRPASGGDRERVLGGFVVRA
jgi:hypothetical protein